MAPKKETIMALKVDLDCPRCYKKVKRLLCQFHQIHDQVFNEKQNTVMIKVVCCSPEKIRDKLCCKGGKSIKSIEILQPKTPPPPPPPAENPPPEKPADPAPAPPPPAEVPKEEAPPPEEEEDAPPAEPVPPPSEPVQAPPPSEPVPAPISQSPPVQRYPVCQVNPVNVCCSECYMGHRTGPCNHGYGYGYGYGVPAPPTPAAGWGYYGGYYPAPGSYGGYNNNNNNYKPGYCVSRCGDYISDENPTACVIM